MPGSVHRLPDFPLPVPCLLLRYVDPVRDSLIVKVSKYTLLIIHEMYNRIESNDPAFCSSMPTEVKVYQNR
jgi:hypothetical protein